MFLLPNRLLTLHRLNHVWMQQPLVPLQRRVVAERLRAHGAFEALARV